MNIDFRLASKEIYPIARLSVPLQGDNVLAETNAALIEDMQDAFGAAEIFIGPFYDDVDEATDPQARDQEGRRLRTVYATNDAYIAFNRRLIGSLVDLIDDGYGDSSLNVDSIPPEQFGGLLQALSEQVRNLPRADIHEDLAA